MANIEFKTLEQFMPYWCQKILPAVYDDSLSYYQLLGRILQKYNEVIEIVNKHSETLVDHENRITAAEKQIELNRQAIEALKAELAKLDEQVKQNTANIAALTERVNGHDEAIEQINTWINNASAFLLVNHRATINPSTHDMQLQVFSTMFPQWTDWYKVIANGGDSWVIMSGTTASDKAIGVLSLTPGQAGQFTAFGAMVEDNGLHYFTATYSRQGSAANLGGTDNWKEVELLDITNIKQSLGNGEYDTISQKVLTQLINSKLNHDMGITGATAGQYINIAEVDSDGKPVTYGFGTPGGGGSGVDIVQTTGQSTTSVMSQKATTDELAKKTDISLGTIGATVGQNIRVKTVSDGKPTSWETFTPSTPTADVSLGITGAETGDVAIINTTDGEGRPNSWVAKTPEDFAYSILSSVVDLGSMGRKLSRFKAVGIPMPSAFVGKTRKEVMLALMLGRFKLTFEESGEEPIVVTFSNGYTYNVLGTTTPTISSSGATNAIYVSEDNSALHTAMIEVVYHPTSAGITQTVNSSERLMCSVYEVTSA